MGVEGKSIIEVPEEQLLCPWSTPAIVIVQFLVAAIAALPCLVIYRQRILIEERLYIHLRWRIQKERLVPGHTETYDAMVSYSSARHDSDWTENVLVRRLGATFKLCLHEREFMPGTSIFDNIGQGIESSQRIIVVLTKAYLQSKWCLMEFKEAYVKLQKHPKFIILIVLQNDAIENIEDEKVKKYIESYTFVRTDDKWFWEKLEYAMPERPLDMMAD